MKKYIKLLLILGIAFNMMHGKALADQSVSGDISSGSYVRQTDGLNGEKFTISGKPGGDLNISGGSFSTASPQIYTNGVTTVRDDNIRLYNPDSKDPVTGLYSLHTKETVEQAYKDGKEAQFAPANNPTAIPTKEEVLKALEAAQDLEAAAKVTAWEIKADGDINVTGGSFDFMTANQSSIAAGGKLNWKNASLVSAGGGGALTIKAPDGINIESGSIRSEGAGPDGPYAQKYDNRGRLDRDRWTLGSYLYFQTDGDIVLGQKGNANGPEVYVGDGMVFFNGANGGAAKGKLYLYSGALTLDGQYRSTLNTGSMAETIIDGGTLNVITADRINRNGVDSASMYLGNTVLEDGTINLYNGHMGGSVTMNGGVINAEGDSAINASSGAVTINGGTVNLGERAFIGAIKGDSLALSPYVTATNSVSLGKDAVVNLELGESTDGTFTTGKNIGGIYTIDGDNATSITVADGATINVRNPYQAGVGTTVVEGFAEASNGSVTLNGSGPLSDNPYYSTELKANGSDKAGLVLKTNDPAPIVRNMPARRNVVNNAEGFADLLVNGQGTWRDFSSAVVATGNDTAAGAELLRQAGGEGTTANAHAILSTVRAMQNTVRDRGFGSLMPARTGTTQELENSNRLWIDAVGMTADQGSVDGRTGYTGNAAGVVAGFDHVFAGRYMAGIALGYARGYFQSNDSTSEGFSDNWYVSLYGSFNFNPLVLDADLFYANTQTSMENSISGFGKSDGDISADTFGGSLTASYVFTFNDEATKIAPYVGIEYLGIHQHGWSDSGYLSRDFGEDFSTLWTLPVGVKASHTFTGDNWTLTPSIGLAYARDLNSFNPEATVSVPGMHRDIVTHGPSLARDSFRGDVGLDFQMQDFSVYLKYNIDAREDFTSHGGTLGIAYHF